MAADDPPDVVPIHFAWDERARLESYRAWCNALPRRFTGVGVILAQRCETVPGRLGGDLAAGVP